MIFKPYVVLWFRHTINQSFKNAFLYNGFSDSFLLLLLLHNLFCIKRSCSVYRQVLKNIQVHGAIERVERRTLIVSDVLHGVLVLVHPNLHLPCWELFDEHVRNRNECIRTFCAIFLCGQKYISRGRYYYTTILECYN